MDGILELNFADGINVPGQVGRTLTLFDWSGAEPTGQFHIASPHVWDETRLYTTGEVRLLRSTPLLGSLEHRRFGRLE